MDARIERVVLMLATTLLELDRDESGSRFADDLSRQASM
jgi:hypothetical protein